MDWCNHLPFDVFFRVGKAFRGEQKAFSKIGPQRSLYHHRQNSKLDAGICKRRASRVKTDNGNMQPAFFPIDFADFYQIKELAIFKIELLAQ